MELQMFNFPLFPERFDDLLKSFMQFGKDMDIWDIIFLTMTVTKQDSLCSATVQRKPPSSLDNTVNLIHRTSKYENKQIDRGSHRPTTTCLLI